MKSRYLLALGLLLSAAALFGAEDEALSPRALLKYDVTDVATSGVRKVRGVVTFVSGIETNRFQVAPQEQTWGQGVRVRAAEGHPSPVVGDYVQAEGRVVVREGLPSLEGARVDVIRHETLGNAHGAKQADFRRGIMVGRRVALTGKIREVTCAETPTGPVSSIHLFIDHYTALVKVPGRLDADSLIGEPVRLTGLAHDVFNRKGERLDATLELAGPDGIEFLRDETVPRIFLFIVIFFGAVVLVFAGVFLFLWLRSRRQRHEIEMIAAERQRMAADLHDTIEQHLAGAKLITAGVLALDDLPDDVREAMKTMSSVLANAKAEVRSAVLNLRSSGGADRTLAESIGDLVTALAKAGVKARRWLRGLPDTLPQGAFQDVSLILREATTNAVKHGKATQVVYTADPYGERGGFVLRVLNDGAPFEVDRALGPETGHYGLSGMRERALRNHLRISWGRRENWTYMELIAEEKLS